jgi:hypothetical protein
MDLGIFNFVLRNFCIGWKKKVRNIAIVIGTNIPFNAIRIKTNIIKLIKPRK